MKTLLLIGLLSCVGCASLQQHRLTSTLQRDGYNRLDPLPVVLMSQAAIKDREFMQALVRGVEKTKDDPEALSKFLARINCVLENDWVNWSDLESRMNEEDELCFFTYSKHNYDDYGVLVLRKGSVVFRQTLGSGLWNGEKDGKQLESPPVVQDFDNL